MQLISVCPECSCSLVKKAKACVCGWRVQEQVPAIHDNRCRYRIDDWRCPLPGSTCRHAYARGPYYCRWHDRVLDDPVKAASVSQEMKQNLQKFLDELVDWREKLMQKYLNDRRK